MATAIFITLLYHLHADSGDSTSWDLERYYLGKLLGLDDRGCGAPLFVLSAVYLEPGAACGLLLLGQRLPQPVRESLTVLLTLEL